MADSLDICLWWSWPERSWIFNDTEDYGAVYTTRILINSLIKLVNTYAAEYLNYLPRECCKVQETHIYKVQFAK